MNHVLDNAWILPRTRRATFSTYSTLFARVQQQLFVLWLPVYRPTVYKLAVSINQSINLLKAKGPIGHLHRSKIHNIKYIKYINTHKHMLLRIA